MVLTLFLVLDSFGNLVFFQTQLSRVSEERRFRVLVRELLISLAVLVFFLYVGSDLLGLLGIRPATLRISGGILLFLIALGMVFPVKSLLEDPTRDEPFIVPLAVPMIAGPSAIALLLLLGSGDPGARGSILLALLLAWAASSAVLLASPWILRWIGRRGTAALERLTGLLLILLAVQMFLDGLSSAGLHGGAFAPPGVP